MGKDKDLIIYGIGETAEIVAEYFQRDSNYNVIGFTADPEFIKTDKLIGLPIIDFSRIEDLFSQTQVYIFVAASFENLNRTRTKMYNKVKLKGYKLASYISSSAYVWHNVEIGENVFIFENNVIQYKARIGNNVILWSGNHVGHKSSIKDNCFLSSHVVISGFCSIGENCFIGVNTCIADHVIIGKDCLIGMGSIINKNIEERSIIYSQGTLIHHLKTNKLFKLES